MSFFKGKQRVRHQCKAARVASTVFRKWKEDKTVAEVYRYLAVGRCRGTFFYSEQVEPPTRDLTASLRCDWKRVCV